MLLGRKNYTILYYIFRDKVYILYTILYYTIICYALPYPSHYQECLPPRSQQSIYMFAEAPISWSFRTLLMLTTAMPRIACLPKCARSFGSNRVGNQP